MDFKDFTNRQEAFDGFVKCRREVIDSVGTGDFFDAFTDLCTKAMSGDCVAQDCVAYFFNKGIPDLLEVNYEYYMSWQILAAANGNEFALEKLEFFLSTAIDEIIYDDQTLHIALQRGTVTKDNALLVIANLLCEGVVDQLKISPKKLIDIKKKPSLYSPEKARVFSDALDKCIFDVIDYLES